MADAFARSGQQALAPLGAVKAVRFVRVSEIAMLGSGEFDIFDVAFAKGVWRFQVLVGPDGKLNNFLMRRAPSSENLRIEVEKRFPESFYVVAPYTGYETKACTDAFEQKSKDWVSPSLVTGIGGLTVAGCPGETEAWTNSYFVHSVLYLGPAAGLTYSPVLPDLYLDEAYRAEISRRAGLRSGRPPTPIRLQDYPVTPRKYRPQLSAPVR